VYRIFIFPFVLNGCESWSLAKKSTYAEGVLRKILGPENDKVAGGWRRLHNRELYDLYSSPNINHVITARKMR
jgi:hypothetical protein